MIVSCRNNSPKDNDFIRHMTSPEFGLMDQILRAIRFIKWFIFKDFWNQWRGNSHC